MAFELNYDDCVHLDAEELAEGGISEAYDGLLPKLKKFIKKPARVEATLDNNTPSYSVRCGEKEFGIYGPDLDDDGGGSWGRATVAFFAIVNDQLAASTHRFYAINDGNDLAGMFLTPAEAKAAQKSLPNKRDWPYLPKDEEPWFGRFH